MLWDHRNSLEITRMMTKLLVVTERYWPDGSGGELATHLILELLKDYFNITVITGTRNPTIVNGTRLIYEPLLSVRNKHMLWYNTIILSRSRVFKKLIEKTDIVYVPRFAFPVISLAKKLGKRVIVHLHDYIPISYTSVILAPFEEHRHRITRDDIMLECVKSPEHCVVSGLTAWWMPRLARKWIFMADTVVCVSKRQAQIVSEMLPEIRDKVKTVYNPPPKVPDATKKPLEKPTFLYSGGGSIAKGFPILLKVLKEIGKGDKVLDARFVFTNTYAQQQIRELLGIKRKYGLNIEVLGRISYEDILRLHSESWALLFPSIWEEPSPYTIVESMLLGTIPIASRVGGVSEIIEETPAERFACKPNDAYCLGEKIKNVLSLSYKELIDLGLKLSIVGKRFSSDRCKEDLIKIFQ